MVWWLTFHYDLAVDYTTLDGWMLPRRSMKGEQMSLPWSHSFGEIIAEVVYSFFILVDLLLYSAHTNLTPWFKVCMSRLLIERLRFSLTKTERTIKKTCLFVCHPWQGCQNWEALCFLSCRCSTSRFVKRALVGMRSEAAKYNCICKDKGSTVCSCKFVLDIQSNDWQRHRWRWPV